jgi:nucleoside-diphosphate-sugar epimerase
VRVLVIGGTRFMGYHLAWRLIAAGHEVTLLNRGTHPDPFGGRVERLRADRTTPEFATVLAGRSFDAAVDFAAFQRADAEGVVRVLDGRVGHYVMISTGQVYLVRTDPPVPSREED